MDYNTVVLTEKGFKMVSDLVPNKDYLVTKSGTLTKFLGFDVVDLDYSVVFNTHSRILMSGDMVIDNKKDETFNLLDIDMIYGSHKDVKLKPIDPIQITTRNKVGLSREACYEIGYRKDFDKLKNVTFTNLTVFQRKSIVAGLIDNAETTLDAGIYTVKDIPLDILRIIVYIIRSLSYDVDVDSNLNSISFGINCNVGILPVKTGFNLQWSIYSAMMPHDDVELSIRSVEEQPMQPGVFLKVDTNEPILIGYSLIPVLQKGEN